MTLYLEYWVSEILNSKSLSENQRVPNSFRSDKNLWYIRIKFSVQQAVPESLSLSYSKLKKSRNSAYVYWWVTAHYLLKAVYERGIFENKDKQVLTLDSSSSEQWLWSWPLILIAKCSLWYTLNWLNPTILLVIFDQKLFFYFRGRKTLYFWQFLIIWNGVLY